MADSKLNVKNLLEKTLIANASDLHLTVGLPPILRIDGQLQAVGGLSNLKPQDTQSLAYQLLDPRQKEIFEREKEIDFSYSFEEKARFRINVFREKETVAVALRLLPTQIRSIQDLGLPPIVENFATRSQGFVLVTGPTGHGKTTTLASLVDKINTERSDHIITIEDPIEYLHAHKKSIVVQRELHEDTHSFAKALRSVLREDPDVVLVGEMRDLETISAAITIAETGHLVFSTLHTNNAAETMDRIIDVFPPHQQPQVRIQLSQILLGVVSQRLLPKIGGGRVAACEVLFTTPAVANLIREGKTYQLRSVLQTGAEDNMIPLEKSLAELVEKGHITLDDATKYANDPGYLKQILGN